MKIKKLLLENINSLYGRWEIDFESPALSDGIFAIMGPTGSGKTTILDAICLALFAETPRIKGGAEFLANEVVSRGAGSCLAEVSFEIDGKNYLASFGFTAYQRNGRNARKGEVNPGSMKHKISLGEKILTETNSDADKKIVEILGMKSDQFYRTVLLAQGKFDAFLAAGANRADVLEQITGTEKYTRIARKINEKYKAVQNELNLRQAEQSGYQLLAPEQCEAKRTGLAELEKTAAEQHACQEQLAGLLTLIDQLAETGARQEQNRTELEELARRQTAFEPDAARLAAGEKAARILPVFQAFSEADEKYRESSKQLAELEGQLPELSRKIEPITARTAEADELVKKRSEEQTRLTGLVAQVSALDQEIRQSAGQLDDLQKQLREQQTLRKDLLSDRKERQTRLEQLETERSQAESYIREHSGDDTLAVDQAQWQEQLNQLGTLRTNLPEREKELDSAAKKLRQTEETIRRQIELTALKQTELEKAQAELEQRRTEKAAILQGATRETLEHQQEMLSRNLNVLKQIKDCQDARKHLVKGEPCPLCGSTVHPYADEKQKVISEDESELNEVRAKLKRLTAAENAVTTAATAASEAKSKQELEENNLKHFRETADGQRQTVGRLTGLLEQERQHCILAQDKLKQQLSDRGFQWDGTERLPTEIGHRIEARRNADRKLQEFEKTRAELNTELKNLAARIEESERTTAECRKRIGENELKLNALKTERNVLFADKDPKAETQAAARRLEDARNEYNRLSQEKSRQEEAIRLGTERKNRLVETIGEERTALDQRRLEFTAACAAEQLTPERFESARLAPAELTKLTEIRTQLRERGQNLTEQREKLAAAWQDQNGKLTVSLQNLSVHLPEGPVREAVANELKGLLPRIDEVQQQIGALKRELDEDQKKRKDLGVLLGKIEALRKKNEIWEQLDKLAGGSDGQNFRRIAQQITLGHLLRAANDTLRRMNDRYELLVGDSDDKLGIDVLDRMRGGEIRSSANLSGGERFQVSLALALGLSSMSGEKIHIDSLFLDEGFGTLDPDSLEHAVTTLSELRRTEGKTIGIISHVKTIGDKIPAFIEVIPEGGGRSRLSGAGVLRR